MNQSKTIVCFGDSNTWGYNPTDKSRFPDSIRWTGILQLSLGKEVQVIEEGLNGRTSIWNDPIEAYPSGKDTLIPCLESHRPIDLVTLLLGTNDLKKHFKKSAEEIAKGIRVLGEMIQSSKTGLGGGPPRLFLLAPPPLGQLSLLADRFEGATEKSRLFGKLYMNTARELGCAFADLGEQIQSSEQDGIHWEPEAHLAVGRYVADRIRRDALLA